ncbi:MAG: sulfatase-like hydrolase/transferase [Massilibacteroides sp.]|nr:sulfatase-like hydrolase/transferase [Massilibacteroides sp.]
MKFVYLLPPFLLGAVSCTTKTTAALEKPNILVIVADDAGYADFGFMGSTEMQTPALDELAAQGTIFTDAHVAASVSSPSRAMMISGRYGQRFGYECNTNGKPDGLPKGLDILPMTLKKAGYATACIGKWHLGEEPYQHPNRKGYDEFYGMIAGARNYFYDEQKSDRKGSLKNYQHNGKVLKFDGYFTDELGSRAAEYIENVGNKPFFMDLCFNAPHSPNEATEDDLDRFEGQPRQVLAAMMYGLDRGVGKVIKALKKTGKLENTLIFFLSDNGGSTTNDSSNFPLKGFKGNKFEGGHRVPFFVVWGDKFKQKEHFKGLTSSLDIFPTVIAAAGISPDQINHVLDGVSLLPYLVGEKRGNPHHQLFWRKMNSRAMRQDNYKLIMTEGVDTVLYDLEKEIDELTDLYEQNPTKSQEMISAYQQFEKANFIAPTWIEIGWARKTDGIHKGLMHNRIKTGHDYNRWKRIHKRNQ